MALIPVYNHVFMALLVEPLHTVNLFSEILQFLWTKQVDGCMTQNQRLVAKKSVAAGLVMKGLRIPHLDETIQGFWQNLEQKIFKQHRQQTTAHLPTILAGLLARANRPTLLDHVQWVGPKQWLVTGNNTRLGGINCLVSPSLQWQTS
jgi:hypothetical protein